MRTRSSLEYGDQNKNMTPKQDEKNNQQKQGGGWNPPPEFSSGKNKSKYQKLMRRLSANEGESLKDVVLSRETIQQQEINMQDFVSSKRVLTQQENSPISQKKLRTEIQQKDDGVQMSSGEGSLNFRDYQFCKFEDLNKDMTSVNLKCQVLHEEIDQDQRVIYLYDGTDTKSWGYNQSFISSLGNFGVRLKRYSLNLSEVEDVSQVPVIGSILVLITREWPQGSESMKSQKCVGIINVTPVVFQGQIMVVGKDDMRIVEFSEEKISHWQQQVFQRIWNYGKAKAQGTIQPIVQDNRWGTKSVWSQGCERSFEFIRDIQRHVVKKPQQMAQFRCLVRLVRFLPIEVEEFVVQDDLCKTDSKDYYGQLVVEDNSGVLEALLLTTFHGTYFFGVPPKKFEGQVLDKIKSQMNNLVYKHNGLWMDCCIKCAWNAQSNENYFILFNTKLLMN